MGSTKWRAGRFFVYGAHDAGAVPHGVIPMKIEAGLAFGTGHHETTALCLGVLSDIARRRKFANVLDLGCGTGLLAIGAAKLWKRRVIASDIDPVAVEVTRDNARANGAAPLIVAVTAVVSRAIAGTAQIGQGASTIASAAFGKEASDATAGKLDLEALLPLIRASLEQEMDRAWTANPNPGRVGAVHRLNRAEYNNAIRDLLAIDLDVKPLLPGDDTADGSFDNFADSLSISTSHLERYMSVARQVTRLATGLPPVNPTVDTYEIPLHVVQEERQSEDLPFGSRGGIAVNHDFAADSQVIKSGDEVAVIPPVSGG